jgi:competence protein ComEC
VKNKSGMVIIHQMEKLRVIPAFKSAIILCTGILFGAEFNLPLLYTIPFFFLILCFGVYFYLYRRADFTIQILTFVVIFIIGFYRVNFTLNYLPENSIANIPDTRDRASYELIGTITELPFYDSTRIRFVLASETLVTSYDSIPVTGDVLVNIRKNIYSPEKVQPVLKPGDRISMLGKLSEGFGERNPGEFDYRRYLRLHDVYKVFYVFGYGKLKIISHENLDYFRQHILYPAKEFALNNIDRHLEGDKSAYLKGLVTGERSDISDEMKEAFINTGVMHLIAVSGLNVAYIIITITLILTLFRVPEKYRIYFMIPALIFYCFFTGAPASIVRATIMGILFLIAVNIQRKSNFYNIVGASALIILIYEPKQLFDPGFILSFCAVISMVFFYERFENIFKNQLDKLQQSGKQYLRVIVVMFLTTLAAQVGTLPITALYFGKISIISLLANLVVVPFANFALAIGFFQILTGIVSDYLSSIIAATNNILLTAQLEFIHWCASFDFAYVDFFGFNIFNTIIYFVCILLLFTSTRQKLPFRFTLIILLALSVLLVESDFKHETTITVIDVGHGNCTLIQTANGQNILVDAGTRTKTYNSSERTIIPLLKRNGIEKLDLLLISNEKNSQGGASYLIRNFKIDRIIQSVGITEDYTIDEAVSEVNITRDFVRAGDLINLGNNTSIYILSPLFDEGVVVLSFIFKTGDFSMIFAEGITDKDGKILALKYGQLLSSGILKISSHGSAESSSAEFLLETMPQISVIQSGKFNRKDLPSVEVISKLNAINSFIKRTDIEGALIFTTDGETIKPVSWR